MEDASLFNMTGPYFIEFEAFQHGEEEFKIKELCIMEFAHHLRPLHYVFRSEGVLDSLPLEKQTTYRYLSNNVHLLSWHEGVVRFCSKCVMHHIEMAFPDYQSGIFYTMESQVNGPKLRYLKKMFPKLNIVNYNVTLNNLPFISPNISCIVRDHGNHCAYLKCLRLLEHYAIV